MTHFVFCIYRLERRFLERVAQTNRVKSSGVSGGGNAAPAGLSLGGAGPKIKDELGDHVFHHPLHHAISNPPWLAPPRGYKHGSGAAMAAAANSRAAAAGRALLQVSY